MFRARREPGHTAGRIEDITQVLDSTRRVCRGYRDDGCLVAFEERRLGVPPEVCVVDDDLVTNVSGARQAGMRAILREDASATEAAVR